MLIGAPPPAAWCVRGVALTACLVRVLQATLACGLTFRGALGSQTTRAVSSSTWRIAHAAPPPATPTHALVRLLCARATPLLAAAGEDCAIVSGSRASGGVHVCVRGVAHIGALVSRHPFPCVRRLASTPWFTMCVAMSLLCCGGGTDRCACCSCVVCVCVCSARHHRFRALIPA